MSSNGEPGRYRILVIDDNPEIYQDFQTILLDQDSSGSTSLDELDAEIFGDTADQQASRDTYDLDYASQGEEGFEKIKQAISENRPYWVAFIDMRMPPGWDGLETIEHIWEIDPDIQVVISTAYSDHSWEEIAQRLGKTANLLILKKPFDNAEVAQLASALTAKKKLSELATLKKGELERMVTERTETLQNEVSERKQAEEELAQTLADTERMNRLMSGREKRVIEMKREVNALLAELGRQPQYQSVLKDETVVSSDKAE